MLQHNGTLAWAVQSADLGAAVQEVRRSAVGQNTPGFMLAFIRNDWNLGFSFLVRSANFSAALHLVQERRSWSPSQCTCAFEQGTSSDYSFVEQYLKTAAANMRMDYGKLVTHFAGRESKWRFQPWQDDKPSYTRDNDYLWRDLWPLVRSVVEMSPPCLDALPSEARTAVLTQLRGHVREGMRR